MMFFWFLVFYALLVVSSSLVQSNDNDLTPKQASIRLNLHHVHQDQQFNSSSISNLLEIDEARVSALRSRLSSSSNNSIINPELISTPLKSGLSIGSGNYYVKVGLGTPPKDYSLLADTGSSLSWIQCQPCKVYCYPQIDPLFNPLTSKTYKKLSCTSPLCFSLKGSTLNDPVCEVGSGTCVYRASYGDSSFSVGYLSQDVLRITQLDTIQGFVYGCGQNNQGLFGRSSGILGLAHDKLSALAQLSNKYGYAFSYCLPTSFSAPKGPSMVGYLSFGTSSLAKVPSYKFTPLIKNPKIPSLYFLSLTGISVAGRPIAVTASSYKVPTIIDSGTVITRLPMQVYEALREGFLKVMVSKKYSPAPGISILDTCFKGSVKEFVGVPEVKFVFQGGAALQLKGHNTLLEIENGVTCFAIAGNPGNNPLTIIGNYQQQTFDVAYDVSNSRIGFSPGGCE